MRLTALTAALCLYAGVANAAELACSEVRLIVPYPAGGATDVAARLLGGRLEASLKKPIVIDNRAGASSNIGTLAVVRAAPNGCTLLVNATTIATFPWSFSKLAYDPVKDLTAVGGIGNTPTVLVTSRDAKAGNLKELVAWAKEKPDGLTFATTGYGLFPHLAAEELAQVANATMAHVAYKGIAQASGDLLTGRVDFGSFTLGSVAPLINDGALKPIALYSDSRSSLVPNIPTTVEQGHQGHDAGVRYLIFAPPSTPKEIVSLLSTELAKIVSDPSLRSRFVQIGFEPTPLSADEASAFMRKTGENWAPVIKRLNIKLD
jgi:tripartite-type tricarboxylate transporter receptor subunit TctC